MSPGATSKRERENDVTETLVLPVIPGGEGEGGDGQHQKGQLCDDKDDNCNNKGDNKSRSATTKGKTDDRPLRTKLRDPEYRGKLMYSLCIAFLFFCTSLVDSQRGIAFLDIQLITDTNLEQISKIFSVNSLGYMSGTLLSGVLAKKINRNLLIFFGLFVASCAFTSIPYCTNYYVLLPVNCVVGLHTGLAETTSNAEQMRLWGDEGKTLIHVIHLGYYLGGIVVPFYTEPFLAKALTSLNNNNSLHDNFTLNSSSTTAIPFPSTFIPSFNALNGSTNYTTFTKDIIDVLSNSTIGDVDGTSKVGRNSDKIEYGPSQIHYAFLITGIIIFCCSLPFLVIFLHSLRRASRNDDDSDKKKKKTAPTSRQTSLPTRILIVMGVSMYFMLYCSLGDVFPHFLMAFLVNEFHTISKSEAAYIGAVFWIASAVASCILIGVSKLLRPVQTAALCVTLLSVSMASFVLSATFRSTVAMTIFTATLGAASSGFGAGLSWCESELMHVREFMSSVIFFSSSFGVLICPLFLGVLIERYSYMWYCYALEIQSGILCIVFCCLFAFNRLYVNKKYGLLHVKDDITISISEENRNNSQDSQQNNDALMSSADIEV